MSLVKVASPNRLVHRSLVMPPTLRMTPFAAMRVTLVEIHRPQSVKMVKCGEHRQRDSPHQRPDKVRRQELRHHFRRRMNGVLSTDHHSCLIMLMSVAAESHHPEDHTTELPPWESPPPSLLMRVTLVEIHRPQSVKMVKCGEHHQRPDGVMTHLAPRRMLDTQALVRELVLILMQMQKSMVMPKRTWTDTLFHHHRPHQMKNSLVTFVTLYMPAIARGYQTSMARSMTW
jgi:hypothetical protein